MPPHLRMALMNFNGCLSDAGSATGAFTVARQPCHFVALIVIELVPQTISELQRDFLVTHTGKRDRSGLLPSYGTPNLGLFPSR